MGSDDVLWVFLRTLLALPVVLALAYLTIRYVLGRKNLTAGPRRMRVVETLPLGGKGALVLIEMGGRYYLLAYQEGAVAVLKEMDELPAPVEAGTAPFGELFDLAAAVPKISALWERVDLENRVRTWRGKHGPR
ncbi:MAG TPA: flagellar biosynthetic protein FliO [Spirochaetia bacterium]|nr:flagellar biosynthetic protein FliO [Spirochaetia bacterium]